MVHPLIETISARMCTILMNSVPFDPIFNSFCRCKFKVHSCRISSATKCTKMYQNGSKSCRLRDESLRCKLIMFVFCRMLNYRNEILVWSSTTFHQKISNSHSHLRFRTANEKELNLNEEFNVMNATRIFKVNVLVILLHTEWVMSVNSDLRTLIVRFKHWAIMHFHCTSI